MDFVYHHRTNGRGGEGVHIMGMVRALEAAGHAVNLLGPPGVDPRRTAGQTPVDKGATPARGVQRLWTWISARAPQLMFELMELAYNVFAWRTVRRALAASPGAVFYERYAFFLSAGVIAARRRGTPVLLEVNEVVGIERARRQLLTPVMRLVERATFRRADALLCVSSFLAAEATRRGARPGTVHVLPNAVDPVLFDARGSGAAVRRTLGLPEHAVVAGFVGWFDAWDRLELLIDAAGSLRATCPQLRVLLVGDGPVAPDLRARAHAAGLDDIVVFSGPVPRAQVPAFIDAMDIGVLAASNPFGSPIVLFELMGMGKAVVAADIGPVRDVMEDAVTGCIVPEGDGAALTAALARLLNEPELRRSVGARGRARVLERHTWAANGRYVADLAARLAGGGS